MQLSQHKTAIGIFFLTGIALLIAGVLLLGGKSSLFSTEQEYSLYFKTSVNGLSVGAPVMFRGVRIGSVTRIQIIASTDSANVTIPVYITLDSNASQLEDGTKITNQEQCKALIIDMIAHGLQGSLESASLVTGQYRVILDFYPDTDNTHKQHPDDPCEIPTRYSPMDLLQRNFKNFPVRQILNTLQRTLKGIQQIVESGTIGSSLDAIEKTFTQAATLLEKFQKAPEDTTKLLKGLEGLTSKLDRELPSAISEFRKTMQNFSDVALELKSMASSSKKNFAQIQPLTKELENLIRETSSTARALRNLATSLERNPESLIRGKKGAY